MPLLWFTSGFVLGLLLSLEVSSHFGALLLLAASLACSYLFLRSVGLRLGTPLLVVAGLLLGLARGGPSLLDPPGNLHLHHGLALEVRGQVTTLPELVSGHVRLNLEVAELRQPGGGWAPASGTLLARVAPEVEPLAGRSYPYLAYGDRLVLRGVMDSPEPFSGFDYPRYLASQGIGSVMSNARVVAVEAAPCCGWGPERLHRLRTLLADSLARVLPEPAGGLTQALLLGFRGGLPPSVTEAFQRSGTAHLLAISGLQVSMVLVMAVALSRSLLGRRRGLYLLGPFLLIWAYAFLAGATPSVLRASLMGTAYLLALASGRSANTLNALAAAALLMLAWQPRWLWHLSFQLSFAAMAGMLIIGLPAWDYFRRTWWPGGAKGVLAHSFSWAVGGLLISAGAVLATLPLVTFNFHQVPLFGIPATLLMLPAFPPLLVGGFLAGAAETAWAPLGLAVAWLPALLADFLIVVARAASAVPWGVVRLPEIGVQLVWAYYLILLGVLATVHRSRWLPPVLEGARALWSGPSQTRHRMMVVAALLPLVVSPWALGFARSGQQMHLYFLDVGQGDASLIRTPSGLNLLIDGGPDEAITVAAVDSLLPRFDRTIDVAFVTNPDADHFRGLMGMARRGRLRMVVVPPVVEEGDGLWRRQLESTGVLLVDGRAGVSMTFPDGVRLRLLHPPLPPLEGTGTDVNNNSLVLEVSFRRASVLYPGDIETEGEWVLLDSGAGLSTQVLKLAHHGSNTSSTAELLRAVAPAIVVVSAGKENSYGHPSPAVLERASQLLPGHRLYSTALQGTIHLTTDGERWWARTSR